MTEESPIYPLVEASIRHSPLPRSWTIATVASLLLLLLIPLAYLDGSIAGLLDWDSLRYILFNIFFIVYFLLVYPFMMRWREQAALAFRPLLALEDDAFNQLVTDISKPNRRWEWTATILGATFFVGAIFQPWNLDWSSGYIWLNAYFVIVTTILYGLLSWLIYDTFISIVRISRLSRKGLKLDIVDVEMLLPVARWSLGISVIFVGAISLSVIENWEILLTPNSIAAYVLLGCTTVLIFFLSMRSVHRAMNEAKMNKMAIIRKHMKAVSNEVDKCMEEGQISEMEKLASTLSVLVNYHKLVSDTPTWPFNADTIRRLFVSMLVPVAVYVVKIFSRAGIGLGS